MIEADNEKLREEHKELVAEYLKLLQMHNELLAEKQRLVEAARRDKWCQKKCKTTIQARQVNTYPFALCL